MIKKKNFLFFEISKFASEDFRLSLVVSTLLEIISIFQVISSVIRSTLNLSTTSYQVSGVAQDFILASGIVSLWDITTAVLPSALFWGFSVFILFNYGFLFAFLCKKRFSARISDFDTQTNLVYLVSFTADCSSIHSISFLCRF